MKFFVFSLLMMIAYFAASKPESCSVADVHPLLTATVDVDTSNDVSQFMNGITAQCPTGLTVSDPNHTLHSNMSYKDTLNAIARLSCIRKIK